MELDFCPDKSDYKLWHGASMSSLCKKGSVMEMMNWIKDLVLSEQKMEEEGVVDFSMDFGFTSDLKAESHDFIQEIKASFIETASVFNQLRSNSEGSVKIYGISGTEADFMLFRNGYKLIFSIKEAGTLAIRFHNIGQLVPQANTSEDRTASNANEALIIATKGPFGELTWKYQGQEVKTNHLVKYYFTRFIKESTK